MLCYYLSGDAWDDMGTQHEKALFFALFGTKKATQMEWVMGMRGGYLDAIKHGGLFPSS
jgi:hypothetical protein